ncbi:MAG: hypothetical protein Q7S44_00425 [bacterium]|nr:hypothetical protein [bacterium]
MNNYLLAIILAEGLLWFRSSLGKFPPEKFIGNLGGTLTRFADKNPYPWYKDFLQNTAIPNSQVFGFLTFWGEFLVALSLTLGSLYLLLKMGKSGVVKSLLVLGLLGGMFLNMTFWLASGWMSASTDSLNLFMFVVGLISLVYVLKTSKS